MNQNVQDECYDLIAKIRAHCGTAIPGTLLARLETAVERLTDEISVLRMVDATPGAESKWHAYGIEPSAVRVLQALERAGSRGMSKESILAYVCASKSVDEWPEVKIVDVWVCHIRKQLQISNAPYWIETIWGSGLKLHNEPLPEKFKKSASEIVFYRDLAFQNDTAKRRKNREHMRKKRSEMRAKAA